MLIEFRVENHRSLRDEQALTLEAGRSGESSDPRPRDVAGHGEKLLPAAAIYGANASGKSNVLSALTFMREAVVLSHRQWEPEGGIPRTPFAWGGKRNESSLFEVTFLVEETKYVYGFSADDEVVKEEWLYAWPNNRKQVWFEREGNKFKFGDHLKGPNEVVKEVTRSNALFLSAAAQNKHEQLSSLFAWFRGIMPVNVRGEKNQTSFRFVMSRSPMDNPTESLRPIRQLLKLADIGVVSVKMIIDEGHDLSPKIQLQHQAGDKDSWLDLEEESEGTKTLFEIGPSVLRTLVSGGLLLVDELESSLHPSLGLAIVKMFNCPKANPRNAQIVFTTHDTNLLGTTLGEPPLRRDQIWFTEKDKEGASKLYPLTDYKPRKAENLERGYLQGRYGSIPFLGDIAKITE